MLERVEVKIDDDWTFERQERLRVLVERGYSVRAIALDPIVDANARQVRKRTEKFRAEINRNLDAAASARGMTRSDLVKALTFAAGSSISLIDNILDDGVQTS